MKYETIWVEADEIEGVSTIFECIGRTPQGRFQNCILDGYGWRVERSEADRLAKKGWVLHKIEGELVASTPNHEHPDCVAN